MIRLISALSLLSLSIGQRQTDPFYSQKDTGQDLVSKIRFNEYSGPGKDPHPDIDTAAIIAPIMRPFMEMYDAVHENYRAKKKAEEIERQKEDAPLSNSKSLFELIERLQRPTTTTTPPPPLIERLLKPYIEPWQEISGLNLNNMMPSTTQATTTTTKQNMLEKSLAMFFPSLRKKSIPAPVPTTTETPTIFDPNYFARIERLLFSRDKREANIEREKRQATLAPAPAPAPGQPPALHPLLPSLFPAWEKPILDAANPFTPNPLMAMFTTKKPIEIHIPEGEKYKPFNDPGPLFQPKFKLQDPFYNPLFPNRKSKLFDFLAGGQADRVLG